MLAVNDAGSRARWEVLWIRKGKVQRKDCGNNLIEAIEILERVKAAGRKGATLRCKNMGFPPPAKYLPYEEKQKVPLERPVIVKRGGKRYRKTHEVKLVSVNPMEQKNRVGIWWCPYCMKLRRFVKQKSMKVDNVTVMDTAMACPMCKVTHRDHNVRKYNPMALQVYYELELAPRRATARDRKANYRRKRRQRG